MKNPHQKSDIPSEDKYDLQQIKGVGPAIAKALRSHGIRDCAALVSFTSDSLADLLKTKIPNISSKRIEGENWIDQARALVHSQAELESPRPDAHDSNAPSAKGQEKETAKAPRKDWRELADFFVSFGLSIGPEGEERLKTKVHHSQADEPKEWDGIVTDELIQWIINQIPQDESLPPESEVTTPLAPAAPYDARIRIRTIRLSEVPKPLGMREKKLKAEVGFQLSGPDAKILEAQQISFRVELHVVDMETKVSKLVASKADQLRPGMFEHVSEQAFPLPKLGRYELHTIVLLLPPGEMMANHQGPIINVVL
jgi:hypothetical protein